MHQGNGVHRLACPYVLCGNRDGRGGLPLVRISGYLP